MELVVVVHGGGVKLTYSSVLIYYMNTPTLTPKLQSLPLKHIYRICKPWMSEYSEIEIKRNRFFSTFPSEDSQPSKNYQDLNDD